MAVFAPRRRSLLGSTARFLKNQLSSFLVYDKAPFVVSAHRIPRKLVGQLRLVCDLEFGTVARLCQRFLFHGHRR
jgi:hypothetical protein